MKPFFSSSLVSAITLLCGSAVRGADVPDPVADQAAFEEVARGPWHVQFIDPGIGDWRQRWFLDGEVGMVKNTPEGMELTTWSSGRRTALRVI